MVRSCRGGDGYALARDAPRGRDAAESGTRRDFPFERHQARHAGHRLDRFSGTTPEPVPVEIIGVWKKASGPNDVILGKMGGKAKETNVAGGMSGSPVYIDGKLVGAVALRISVFSPDSICGITPIESMLEVRDFDASQARGPGSGSQGSGVPAGPAATARGRRSGGGGAAA